MLIFEIFIDSIEFTIKIPREKVACNLLLIISTNVHRRYILFSKSTNLQESRIISYGCLVSCRCLPLPYLHHYKF